MQPPGAALTAAVLQLARRVFDLQPSGAPCSPLELHCFSSRGSSICNPLEPPPPGAAAGEGLRFAAVWSPLQPPRAAAGEGLRFATLWSPLQPPRAAVGGYRSDLFQTSPLASAG
eukprot:1196035-Prorocentrum_minimum.AAC.1